MLRQSEKDGRFPNYLWRLDHATLTNTSSEFFGIVICSSKADTSKPADTTGGAGTLASEDVSRDVSCPL